MTRGRGPATSRAHSDRAVSVSPDTIRARLDARRQELGWSARRLAQETGDSPKNVQRWIYGESQTIPADFVGRCVATSFVSADYVFGLSDDPEPRPESEYARQVAAIRRVLAG